MDNVAEICGELESTMLNEGSLSKTPCSYTKSLESPSWRAVDMLSRSKKQLITCLKSFWNRAWGSVFQAIVSVIAVKIQFSSPRGVFLSVCFPGMRSIRSRVKPSLQSKLLAQNQRSATCATAESYDKSITRNGPDTHLPILCQ